MSENEELEEEIEHAVKSKSDRVIEIKHSGLVDKKAFEKLREELEEKNQILALQAEKSFRDEKASVLEQVPEEKREEIENLIGENPDVLENLKATLILQDNQQPERGRKAPSGKASLPIRDSETETIVQSGQKNEYQLYVDDLYKRAKLSANPQERQTAESEIEQLFSTYHQSQKDNPDKPFKVSMSQCLNCGAMLFGDEIRQANSDKCPYCGYKPLGEHGFVKYPKGLQSY